MYEAGADTVRKANASFVLKTVATVQTEKPKKTTQAMGLEIDDFAKQIRPKRGHKHKKHLSSGLRCTLGSL
jgi:hypothetical protein